MWNNLSTKVIPPLTIPAAKQQCSLVVRSGLKSMSVGELQAHEISNFLLFFGGRLFVVSRGACPR